MSEFARRSEKASPLKRQATGASKSVARNLGIDLERPAIDAASHGLGGFDALVAEPVGNIEAAHAVMTEADDVVVGVELLKIRGNGAHGNEHSACDAAEGVFVGLTDINEEEFITAVEALFDFNCGDF